MEANGSRGPPSLDGFGTNGGIFETRAECRMAIHPAAGDDCRATGTSMGVIGPKNFSVVNGPGRRDLGEAPEQPREGSELFKGNGCLRTDEREAYAGARLSIPPPRHGAFIPENAAFFPNLLTRSP